MSIFRLPCPPVVFFLLAATGFAAGPQDLLPPVLPWHGASEALIAKPDNPWITSTLR